MRFTIAKAITATAPKANLGVVGSGSSAKLSSSPKATGVAGKFSLGSTSGGKKISSYSHKESTSGWSSRDHLDAYRAHAKHVSSLDPSDTHPDLIRHHKEAMQTHWQAQNSDVKKAKKQKHHIIGHTRSGQDIHAERHAAHGSHKGWSKEDHRDAGNKHHQRAMKLLDSIAYFSDQKHGGKHHKLIHALKHSFHKHAHHAGGHSLMASKDFDTIARKKHG